MPDNLTDIAKGLADVMKRRFTPPEFIPGCKVVSVDDVDQYATNNGWIEAICGQHNQQRCRWRGQYASIAVDDYVDVMYFPDRRLFEVHRQGGSGALSATVGAANITSGTATDGYVLTADGAGGADWEDALSLDSCKVSKLYESDGGAVAWQTDAAGNLSGIMAIQGIFDHQLADTTNTSGITSHFLDNTSTYPTGWTEVDASLETDTNNKLSNWFLSGSAAEASWKYRIQSNITLESMGASDFVGFMFGPLFVRDVGYSIDIHYRFGMYRDNSGTIDENTYIRLDLYWNSSSQLWQIRGEESDGTTAHTGSYVTIDQNPLRDIFGRVSIINNAAKTARALYGGNALAKAHSSLLQQVPTSAPTWGQVWVQVEMTRTAASLGDYLYIGAIDYVTVV